MNYTSCLQCFCFLCLLIYLTWFSNSDCSRPKGGSTDVHIAPPYLVRCTGKYASPTSSFSLPTSTSCSLGWSEVRCFEWRLLQEAFFPVTATRILSLTMKDHNSNFKHSCSPQPTHPITPSLFFLVVNRHTDVHCLITYSFYRHIISPSFSLCLSAAHPHTPICHCIKVTFKRLDKDARQTCLIPQSCLPLIYCLIVSYFASNLHNITTKHTQIYRVIKPRFS